MKFNLKNRPKTDIKQARVIEAYALVHVEEWFVGFEKELRKKLVHYKAVEKQMKQKLATTQFILRILGDSE